MTQPKILTGTQYAALFYYLQQHTFGMATTGPAINLAGSRRT